MPAVVAHAGQPQDGALPLVLAIHATLNRRCNRSIMLLTIRRLSFSDPFSGMITSRRQVPMTMPLHPQVRA